MIGIYNDYEALSHAAAGMFVQQVRQATQEKGWFSVALAGGHTPRRTYELLADPTFGNRVPWRQVHIFWGDERCVPHGDERSNTRMVRRALLDHVPVPTAQIHPIACGGAADEAAQEYEADLKAFFGDNPPQFDLIFLGLGENGHTASLFPHTPVLDEQERWVQAVHVAEQDMDRVTLTAPLINQAAAVVFLVSGESKAAVVKEVLEGGRHAHRLPAQLIRPAPGELHWLLDREAAAMLTQRA